ncbi:MAG: SRPBCC family protein [Candidatus Acidiferrales bacterium]
MVERKSGTGEDTSDCEIVITRVFDAPRELVWQAWTDPKQVARWWGPRGFTTTIHEMDVREGGVWRQTMHGPDGTDYPGHSKFLEVVKPERIVFSHGGGKAGDAGAQFQSTWTFEAQGEKTKLTIRMVFATSAEREHVVKVYGAIEGGHQTLGRLAEYLTKLAG